MIKNVWFFNHYATNMYADSAGRHYWFASELIKNGYNVTIFCANTIHNTDDVIDIPKGKYLVKNDKDVPFVFVKTSKYKGNGLSRINNMFGFYKNLFRVSKRHSKYYGKPDIIIASSVHPLTMIAGIKIAKKFKVPSICEIRDLWPEAIFAFNRAKEKSFVGRLLVKGEHWIYNKANALIFTKEGDPNYIIEKKWDKNHGGKIDMDNVHYINNGINLEQFDKNINRYQLDDKDLKKDVFNVVYVGAMRPVNNVDKLVYAAERLKDNENIQIILFGSGDEYNNIQTLIQSKNLSNIKLKGRVEKKYIPHILSKANINVLNYSQKQYNWARGNSSNKLFEYMAAGKPVVSTVKMGYSQIEKYDFGTELYNASPQDLAETIVGYKKMHKDEYNRLSENARKAAQDFDYKVLTQRLINIIENMRDGI